MKVILTAVLAMVVIAVGSNVLLQQAGFSAQDQTSGTAVRLD